jgi:hypothetical protein
MLKQLKRWLGWESESDLPDFAALRYRPPSAPPAPKPPAAPHTRSGAQSPAAPNPSKTERGPLDKLDNPRLTLDKPPDENFDPYNTGAFNRSASWERIGRQRKR